MKRQHVVPVRPTGEVHVTWCQTFPRAVLISRLCKQATQAGSVPAVLAVCSPCAGYPRRTCWKLALDQHICMGRLTCPCRDLRVFAEGVLAMPAQDLRQRLPTGALLHFRNHAAGPAAAVKALRLLTDPTDCPRRRILSGTKMPRLNECRHAFLLFLCLLRLCCLSPFRQEVAEKMFGFPPRRHSRSLPLNEELFLARWRSLPMSFSFVPLCVYVALPVLLLPGCTGTEERTIVCIKGSAGREQNDPTLNMNLRILFSRVGHRLYQCGTGGGLSTNFSTGP